MLQTQTSNLPQDQQQRLHPDFLANEQAYLHMRPSLLAQYQGQWVAVQDGKVIAAGSNLMEIMDMASTGSGHPYIALVGAEDAVVFARVRRLVFTYDQTYQPFPLPRLKATFWNHAETHSQQHPDVIPDTGADLSVLPDTDCTAIDLFNSPYLTGIGMLAEWSVAASPRCSTAGRSKSTGSRYAALIQPHSRWPGAASSAVMC